MSIRQDIAEFLHTHYNLDLDSISPDATMQDIGLDSLGVLTIADLIETNYGISLDDERIASVRTFAGLLDLIKLKLAEAAAAETQPAEGR
ncbi:acyl carrier protein [Nocardia yamanashiensis]|uniref:acyl carrier protein n=1 Tax=Nocardia yamanashiensis TaxID=209247 RepID=UPI001E5B03D3|nr:acyl carrier protein [Nocardia yamanashiensis]UGT41918.1 acyl carrier protein [Nocardia yamanashiensis]